MLGDFNENFTIIRADGSKQLLNQCFRLRYEIFCLEKGLFSDREHVAIESDEYDPYSLHYLLAYNPTKEYVGTVRLILGKLLDQKKFPIEEAARKYFYDVVDYKKLERNNLAEISRFAIAPEFRPKFAVLGILRAVIEACIEHNVDYTYAAIEPRVQRILQRIGIQFREISPVISYHGERQCFLGFTEEILASAYSAHPLIWEVLTDNGKLCPRHIFCHLEKSKRNVDDDIYNYR